MKDWPGNALAVGDTVIYPAGSGRSITMVVGQIIGFGEGAQDWRTDEPAPTIKIQPLRASRWKQHHGRSFYVDTRTGKRIDPHLAAADGSFPHIADGGYYLDRRGGRHERQRYTGTGSAEYEYVSTVFAAHVERRHEGPGPVTIQITENVTKWTGTLPAAAETADPEAVPACAGAGAR